MQVGYFNGIMPLIMYLGGALAFLLFVVKPISERRGKANVRPGEPNLNYTSPLASPEQPTGPLIDGQRLQRPAWQTPVSMTLYIIVGAYVLFGLVGMMGHASRYAPEPTFSQGIADAGSAPIMIGLLLGLCGLLAGSSYANSARDTVGERFGVQILPNDHALTRRVHVLAAQLELPPPAVGLTAVTNAFAVGRDRDHALVVIGAPLIRSLPRDQLDAVIGHELGHIVSGDMRRMQIAEGFQRMFGGVFSAVSRIALSAARTRTGAQAGHAFANLGRQTLFFGSELMVKRLSRSREFHADAVGAALTSPAAMIGALEWIHQVPEKASPQENQYGYLMFRGGAFGALFSTHPTLESRRAALLDGTLTKAIPYKAISGA